MTVPVLVADSDPANLEHLDAIFTRRGFRVIATHDGGDALARFFENEPRLVVCHEELPVLSGAALCQQVKSQDSQTRVVIIARGSSAASAAEIQGQTGCDAVLCMPVSEQSLDDALDAWSMLNPHPKPDESQSVAANENPLVDLIDADFDSLDLEESATSSDAALATETETETDPDDPFSLSVPIPIPALPLLTPIEPSVSEAHSVAEEVATSAEIDGSAEHDVQLDAAAEDGDPLDGEAGLGTEAEIAAEDPSEGDNSPNSDEAAGSPLEWVASVARPTGETETVFGDAIPSPMSAFESSVRGYVEASFENGPASFEPARERVSDTQLRDSLPEPGVEDLPMGPGGSLGLRGDRTAFLPPGLPSAGDLSAMPLPRMVYELYISTFTGVLTLSKRGDRRRVFLWGGFPVRVESKDVAENLGYMMLNSGRLTQSQYEQMEEKIRGESLRAGDALRALGLVSDRELLAVMRKLNEERMVNTFSWREGTYTFEARVDFADGTVFGEVHPLAVIWRGIHEHYDLEVLFKYFSALRQRFIVTTRQFGVHFAALGPFLRNLNVQSILSGEMTFEQALRSDDSRAIELSQLLYFLLVTDMIKPQARPGEPPKELLAAAPVEVTLPLGAVDYRELASYSEKIATEYLRLKDDDHSGALSLEQDADVKTIELAYSAAVADFVPEKLPPGLADDMLRKVREIHAMLQAARVTLTEKAQQRKTKQTQAMAVRSYLDDTSSSGPTPDALYQQAQALMAEKRFADAEGCLRQAISLGGGSARFWVTLAQASLFDPARDPVEAQSAALESLERGFEEDSADVTVNFELAKLLAKADQPDRARDHLRHVVQRAPGHAEARRLLAQLSAAATP